MKQDLFLFAIRLSNVVFEFLLKIHIFRNLNESDCTQELNG